MGNFIPIQSQEVQHVREVQEQDPFSGVAHDVQDVREVQEIQNPTTDEPYENGQQSDSEFEAASAEAEDDQMTRQLLAKMDEPISEYSAYTDQVPIQEPIEEPRTPTKEPRTPTKEPRTPTKESNTLPAAPKPPCVNPKYIKFLGPDCTNYNFKFVLGRNVDTKEFNPERECGVGGLYFCTPEFAHNWIANHRYEYLAEVEVPEEAEVVHMMDKSKADMIDITSITPLDDHPIWQDPAFTLRCLKEYPKALAKIQDLSDIPLESVPMGYDAEEILLKRADLTVPIAVRIAEVSLYNIRKLPANITSDRSFWTALLEKDKGAILYMPGLSEETVRKVFYGIGQFQYMPGYQHTPTMKFLASLVTSSKPSLMGIKEFHELNDAELALNMCRWSNSLVLPIDENHLSHEMVTAKLLNLHEGGMFPNEDANKCYDKRRIADFDACRSQVEGLGPLFKQLIEKNQFLSKLHKSKANRLETVFGGFVREFIVRQLASDTPLEWSDFNDYLATSDIDLNVSAKLAVKKTKTGKRIVLSHSYNLTELVAIVKECGGAIEHYASRYGSDSRDNNWQKSTEAAAGTYVVWIPTVEKVMDVHGDNLVEVQDVTAVPTIAYEEAVPSRIVRKYIRYDVNIGTEENNSDLLINSAEACFRTDGTVFISGLHNKPLVDMFKNRDIFPSRICRSLDMMHQHTGKVLMRVGKLFSKGYKLSKEIGLLYHLQILMCRGFAAEFAIEEKKDSENCIQYRKKAAWHRGGIMGRSAYVRTGELAPSDEGFSFEHHIAACKFNSEQITPQIVLDRLPAEFVKECADRAAEWNEDFSIVEEYTREWINEQVNRVY